MRLVPIAAVNASAAYAAPVASALKRLVVGKPIASADLEHQRISKIVGLPVFSSDAISSTAYATEEILFVAAAGSSSLALGLAKLVPIAIVVAVLLVIVVISYRQTIFAYPSGGGSYIVSRENLGEFWSVLAAASLLIDYILTVAVSISAGVAAIVSIPALRGLADKRVILCLALVLLMMLANLRGLKESGALFAPPVYVYIGILLLMLAIGFGKEIFGSGLKPIPFDPKIAEDGIKATGGSLGVLLLLRAFSSGAVALTGVEAISNGVPAFRKPESKNAASTMTWMGIILGSLFFGTSVLAHRLHPMPSHSVTVMAQMGEAVFGKGNVLYFVLQAATALILTLAANTAYADFPRLSSLIAADGYLPRQFANRGDRLVFSNGIVFLSGAASILLVIFGGKTNALIPLYAVGVFTAFTLSQLGMVQHHRKLREKNWQLGIGINGVGAVATFIVLLIVAISKFTEGAWVPLVIVPLFMVLFFAIKKHYRRVNRALAVTPQTLKAVPINHTVVVLVGRVHRGVLRALVYAKSLRPQHLVAVCVASDEAEAEKLQRNWQEFGLDIPLEIVNSPYRELNEPIVQYIEELDQRWDNDTITVVIPEFVVTKWYQQALHNQTALRLKGALLFREGIVVTSVPYLVDGAEAEGHIAELKEQGFDIDDAIATPSRGAHDPHEKS